MLKCPLCQRANPPGALICEGCKTDLSLLSRLSTDVQSLLDKADKLRSDGQLAPAVQAYLDVLDADPTNAEARMTLGPVLRALRAPQTPTRSSMPMLVGAAIALAGVALGYWLALSPK